MFSLIVFALFLSAAQMTNLIAMDHDSFKEIDMVRLPLVQRNNNAITPKKEAIIRRFPATPRKTKIVKSLNVALDEAYREKHGDFWLKKDTNNRATLARVANADKLEKYIVEKQLNALAVPKKTAVYDEERKICFAAAGDVKGVHAEEDVSLMNLDHARQLVTLAVDFGYTDCYPRNFVFGPDNKLTIIDSDQQAFSQSKSVIAGLQVWLKRITKKLEENRKGKRSFADFDIDDEYVENDSYETSSKKSKSDDDKENNIKTRSNNVMPRSRGGLRTRTLNEGQEHNLTQVRDYLEKEISALKKAAVNLPRVKKQNKSPHPESPMYEATAFKMGLSYLLNDDSD